MPLKDLPAVQCDQCNRLWPKDSTAYLFIKVNGVESAVVSRNDGKDRTERADLSDKVFCNTDCLSEYISEQLRR